MAAIKESNSTLISGHEYRNGNNIMSRCRLVKVSGGWAELGELKLPLGIVRTIWSQY